MQHGTQIILEQSGAYMKSRVLLSAAELDVFTRLDGARLTAAQLGSALAVDERALTRLLDCLATLGYVEKKDEAYTLAEVARDLTEAGFVEIRQVRQGERMDCLVEARKPGSRNS